MKIHAIRIEAGSQAAALLARMDNRLLGPDIVCWRNRVMKLKTADNGTGFHNVLKQDDAKRNKPYYAKYLPPGETKQRTLPGSSSAAAWEVAALHAI